MHSALIQGLQQKYFINNLAIKAIFSSLHFQRLKIYGQTDINTNIKIGFNISMKIHSVLKDDFPLLLLPSS